MVSTRAATVITGIGAVMVLAGGLVGFIGFPKMIENRIIESLQLVNGSIMYQRWEVLPVPVTFKVYFFNVSNPDDVQKGAKPIVREIGPYVYKQYRMKLNITKEGEVLSYYQHRRYEFDENASAPLKEDDEITIVNLPLMGAARIAEYGAVLPYFELGAFDGAIPTIYNNPSSIFLTTTPKDFIFDGIYLMCNASGIVNNIICNMIDSYAIPMMPRLEDGRFRFSLYGHKNNTHTEYYTVNSGSTDITKLGEVLAWNDFSTLDIWRKNSTCNKISGTDGTLYPPFRTMNTTLKYFNTDSCRSVKIDYTENITFSGINAYRYTIRHNVFTSPSNHSENECYCLEDTATIRGGICPLDGVTDLWTCQGAPVFLSFPHFYLANEVYRNGVEGLKPNKSLHTMFADLEPMTGVILRAVQRGQVNIFIRPIDRIGLTANLPTTLMPVLWIEESFEFDDELTDLIKTQLFLVLHILSIVKWSTLICGAILFTFGLIWVLISIWGPQEFTKLPSR